MASAEVSPAPRMNAVMALHLIGFLIVAAGVSINPLKITKAFFSDEAVYYTMTYSLAFDHDLLFTRDDLLRSFRETPDGARGIILKINERDRTIVFGKSFLYPLLVAPFVRVCGTNGFFVLNALLFWLNLLCGYSFCRRIMRPQLAVLFSLFYFMANVSMTYLLWMTPEYLNMSLVCFAFFFFMKAAREQRRSAMLSILLSGICFALATYSKPTNALLAVFPGIWMLLNKRILHLLAMFAVTAFVVLALFGINVAFTGQWNYQAGHRYVFYDHFPFERIGTSPFAAFKNRKEIEALKRPPFYARAFLYNWGYFFLGRFSGVAWYFFPMLFSIIYFWSGPKESLSTIAYAAGWLGIVTYMVGIPWNYFGGSGTIGNRYLMNAYAVMLFAVPGQPSRKCFVSAACAAVLFASPILATPVLSSFYNSFHQSGALFTMMPVEKTLVGDLPISSEPRASRIAFDQTPGYLAYFVDDNTYYRETFEGKSGFWVKGGKEAQVMVRTMTPASALSLEVKSLGANRVAVSGGRNRETLDLKAPVFYRLPLWLSPPFPYDRENFGPTYVYALKIHPLTGVVSTIGEKGQERYLGCFVRINLQQAPAFK